MNNSLQVRLGEHTIDQDRDCDLRDGHIECAPPVRDYGIECIIRHQSYTGWKGPHNIALIRLNRDVQFEGTYSYVLSRRIIHFYTISLLIVDHIQPICLPVTDSLKTFNSEKYIIAGWGETERREKSKDLLKGMVTPNEQSVCKAYLDFKLYKSHRCVAQVNGQGLCRGDYGGPVGYIAWYNGLRFVQFGVFTLWFTPCFGLSVYTNVADYMDWILANIKP